MDLCGYPIFSVDLYFHYKKEHKLKFTIISPYNQFRKMNLNLNKNEPKSQ